MPVLLFGSFDDQGMPSNMTTSDLIRDRAIDVIESLVPTYFPGTKFRRYRNEGDGDFLKWAENNPADALRRFQVRDDGVHGLVAVSNTDYEQRTVKLSVMIAYPHDARAGAKQALDRDTAMDRDHDSLEKAIGLYGRANFSSPYPDGCLTAWQCTRYKGTACDVLTIEASYLYVRSLL